MMNEQIDELLRKIISSIVDDDSKIEIHMTPGEHTIIINLAVAKEDTGKVIGKSGKTADAIRTLLRSIGGKINKKVILEIKDNKSFEPHPEETR